MQTPPERSDPESASTGRSAGVKVSNRPVPLATILTVFAIGIGLVMVWKLSFVLLMGFVGVLVAIALRMSANYLSRWLPISPTLGVFLVLALVFLALMALIMNAGPQITQQMRQLIAALPDAWRQVMGWLSTSTLGIW